MIEWNTWRKLRQFDSEPWSYNVMQRAGGGPGAAPPPPPFFFKKTKTGKTGAQ